MDSPSETTSPLQSEEATHSPPFSPPPEGTERRHDALLAGMSALAYLALFQITLRIAFGQIAVVVATILSLLLTLLLTVTASRAMRSPQALALNALVAGILVLPSVLIPVLIARNPDPAHWQALVPTIRLYFKLLASVPGLRGLLLIWFAACAGGGLSRLVRETKMLLPISVVLACVDLYVVFGGGLVTQANTGHAPVAQAAMNGLTVPLAPHPKSGAAPMELSVGFADFMFIALFFACFARFGIPSRRTFIVLCGLLVVYLLVVYLVRIDLPALVPIAVVVIGMNLHAFRFAREEKFALLYAGLILAVVAAGMFVLTRRARHSVSQVAGAPPPISLPPSTAGRPAAP